MPGAFLCTLGIICHLVIDLQNTNLEDIWIELLLPKTKPIYVNGCYRAPHNNNLINCLENAFSQISPEYDKIVLGDFNVCLLKNNSGFWNRLTQMLNIFNLQQLIDKPTRVTPTSSTLLDHIYANNSNNINQSGVIETGISDHFMIYCTRKVTRSQAGKCNSIKIRSMKHYSKELLTEKLQCISWEPVLQCTEVNEAWEKFRTIVTQVMDDIAPEKEIKIKSRTEPWINNEILELMYERDEALRKANQNKSDTSLRSKYNKLRNQVTNTARKSPANYFQNKVEENKNSHKLLWKQFRSIGPSNKSKENSRTVLKINNII